MKEADEHYKKGHEYMNKHQYDDAIKEFSEVARLTPEYSGAHAMPGSCYASKGLLDESIKA